MSHQVSISYEVPCEFYEFNYDRNRKLAKHVPLNPYLLDQLYKSIRKYRTNFRPGDVNLVHSDDLPTKFVSADFGQVEINHESLMFKYNSSKTNVGVLKVSYELVVHAPEDTQFTLEIIEGLIYDAFTKPYSEDGCVDVSSVDMVLDILDTPQSIQYNVVS